MNRLLPEDYMPQIFEYAPRKRIVEGAVEQPLAVTDVIFNWSFEDLRSRRGELGAAAGTYTDWGSHLGEDGVEDVRKKLACVGDFRRYQLAVEGMRPAWTPRIPSTAEVDIAFLFKSGKPEAAKHRNAILSLVVIVPLESLGVKEENIFWKLRIMVDDVSVKQCKPELAP